MFFVIVEGRPLTSGRSVSLFMEAACSHVDKKQLFQWLNSAYSMFKLLYYFSNLPCECVRYDVGYVTRTNEDISEKP